MWCLHVTLVCPASSSHRIPLRLDEVPWSKRSHFLKSGGLGRQHESWSCQLVLISLFLSPPRLERWLSPRISAAREGMHLIIMGLSTGDFRCQGTSVSSVLLLKSDHIPRCGLMVKAILITQPREPLLMSLLWLWAFSFWKPRILPRLQRRTAAACAFSPTLTAQQPPGRAPSH